MSADLDIDDVCAGHPRAEAELRRLRLRNATAWNEGHTVGLTALRQAAPQWAEARERFRDEMQMATDALLLAEADRDRLRAEVEALRKERDEDRRREYGYSQETVDAITQERDSLRAEVEALRAKFEALRAAAQAMLDAIDEVRRAESSEGAQWEAEAALEVALKEAGR